MAAVRRARSRRASCRRSASSAPTPIGLAVRGPRPSLQRLRELDWIESRTVAIEYRWADGRIDRFGEIAAEFVRLKVDVIVTTGGAVLAAKRVSSVIPIVCSGA